MRSNSWVRRPLGPEVEAFETDLLETTYINNVERGVKCWKRILNLYEDRSNEATRFWSQLSASQLGSFRMLHEWFKSKIQDSDGLSLADFYLSQCDALIENSNQLRSINDKLSRTQEVARGNTERKQIAKHLMDKILPPIQEIGRSIIEITSSSTYNCMLVNLFEEEFYLSGARQVSLQTLKIINELIQLVNRVCGSDIAELGGNNTNEVENAENTNIHGIQETRRAAAAVVACQRLSHQIMQPMNTTSNPQHFRNSQQGSHGFLYKSSGAVIEPCPWLANKSAGRPPFYLWDVGQRRTVEVSSLTKCPEYAVISHTWGRFRYEKTDELAGVEGWRIPRNKRFRVKELPEKLAKLQLGKIRYIWLDLLCIPQEECSEDLEKLRDSEIARQLDIFKGASAVYAWFPNISSWKGLLAIVKWLILDYIVKSKSVNSDNLDRRKKASKGANVFLSLYEKKWKGLKRAIKVDPWFRSLWTLQEALIRPDMVFLDAKFRKLALDDQHDIGLDDMIALVHFARRRLDMSVEDNPFDARSFLSPTKLEERRKRLVSAESESGFLPQDLPCGVRQLIQLFEENGIEQVLDASPITALVLGNQRTRKTKRRAEAIMSAIGVTKWSEGQTVAQFEQSQTQNLVLGQYPLTFVNEVQDKFGAQTFNTYSLHDDVENMAGGMLPFTSSAEFIKHSDPFTSDSEQTDHESVEKWEILQDGGVNIPSAGVEFSSELSSVGNYKYVANILAWDRQEKRTIHRSSPNLDEWLPDFGKGTPTYVIRLMATKRASQNLILQDISQEYPRKGKTLIKVGHCYIGWQQEVPLVPPMEVEWKVL